MDQARHVLISNLARHAEQARRRMALSLEAASRLNNLSVEELVAIERGDDVTLSLDELTALALFLGLTVRGDLRSKPRGAS